MTEYGILPKVPTREILNVLDDSPEVASWDEVYAALFPAAPDPLQDEALVERVVKAVDRELDVAEMVMADPITLRRLKAERITRATIAAIKGE